MLFSLGRPILNTTVIVHGKNAKVHGSRDIGSLGVLYTTYTIEETALVTSRDP